MPKAFLFHGTGGHSQENWLPWLRSALESKGYTVTVPDFPEADHPHPSKWYSVIDLLTDHVEADSVLVGHSLGAAVALRFLERIPTQINAVALVGTTLGIPPIKYIEGDHPFLDGGFDWETIRNSAQHFVVFHSDDDPFVCLANGQEAAKQLGVELSFIPNAGHFNAAAGYGDTFPELLSALTPFLS